ncbi:hypothetical protein HIM_07968 [Hirsutella minnesotensis 3608]|uniref:Uncharacterized protein n=1 Tax=Hirsutella minnesotensis 3608 TaxID=1043627 RepID=A0A0F8A3X9_9HYPO|nr:hypothetical protein HIM_07968 [Hirsutella minnesotensis 3608]
MTAAAKEAAAPEEVLLRPEVDPWVVRPYRFTFAINYAATFFSGPNCTGDIGKGPKVNFGCTDHCWPGERALSVMIEAKWYDHRPVYPNYEEAKGKYFLEGPLTDYKYVERDGPIAVAYTSSECDLASRMKIAYVPEGNHMSCTTFDRPARSFQLRYTRDCNPRDQRLKPGSPPGPFKHYGVYDYYKTLPDRLEWKDPNSAPKEEPEDPMMHVPNGKWPILMRDRFSEKETARMLDRSWEAEDKADQEYYLAEHELYSFGYLEGNPQPDFRPGVLWGNTAEDQVGEWGYSKHGITYKDKYSGGECRKSRCKGPKCRDPSKGLGRGWRKGKAGHEKMQDPRIPQKPEYTQTPKSKSKSAFKRGLPYTG